MDIYKLSNGRLPVSSPLNSGRPSELMYHFTRDHTRTSQLPLYTRHVYIMMCTHVQNTGPHTLIVCTLEKAGLVHVCERTPLFAF